MNNFEIVPFDGTKENLEMISKIKEEIIADIDKHKFVVTEDTIGEAKERSASNNRTARMIADMRKREEEKILGSFPKYKRVLMDIEKALKEDAKYHLDQVKALNEKAKEIREEVSKDLTPWKLTCTLEGTADAFKVLKEELKKLNIKISNEDWKEVKND